MLRKFYKMHGIGNDYIYFDCLDTPLENPEAAALKLSDRHFGIGGDGIVLICPSALADAKMRMFNADGSVYRYATAVDMEEMQALLAALDKILEE